jgi:hypothetical protein
MSSTHRKVIMLHMTCCKPQSNNVGYGAMLYTRNLVAYTCCKRVGRSCTTKRCKRDVVAEHPMTLRKAAKK